MAKLIQSAVKSILRSPLCVRTSKRDNIENGISHVCATLFLVAMQASAPVAAQMSNTERAVNMEELGRRLQIGDVVFIRIPHQPFTSVASATSSWTNHVGIVTDVSGAEPVIAESRVPLAGDTSWSRFIQRSDAGRVAVVRLPVPLDAQQQTRLKRAVAARRGILYDTGFDLHSSRQFCSRYVREVIHEATGVEVGKVETFATLLQSNPQADQRFWRMWYFGHIPWQRETVTPASLLKDGRMRVVFDGQVQ